MSRQFDLYTDERWVEALSLCFGLACKTDPFFLFLFSFFAFFRQAEASAEPESHTPSRPVPRSLE